MAGWSFTIIRQPPEDYPRYFDRDTVLASWLVGSGGIRWIEELVDRGEAECVQRGGYWSNLRNAQKARLEGIDSTRTCCKLIVLWPNTEQVL